MDSNELPPLHPGDVALYFGSGHFKCRAFLIARVTRNLKGNILLEPRPGQGFRMGTVIDRRRCMTLDFLSDSKPLKNESS